MTRHTQFALDNPYQVVLVVTMIGMGFVACITDLWKLTDLSFRGNTVIGHVVSIEPIPKGMTTIRLTLDGRTFLVTEPCSGCDSTRGAPVPVTLLPTDPATRVAGSLKDQLWTALIATFVVAPMMLVFGASYSLLELSERAESTAGR